MARKKRAIVIGTGAGGATIARELQGQYQVTILEEGKDFRPFSFPIRPLAKLRWSGLFFDERLIRMLLPNMIVRKSQDMVMVNGRGLGGTTTLATGNAVRFDGALKTLGIDLDPEFDELYKELPITTEHQQKWTDSTRKMFELFEEMGLEPLVTPKLMCADKCCGCGHCAIGCPTNAKWDTRAWVDEAVAKGARLLTGCKVLHLEISDGKVTGVCAKMGRKRIRFHADLVVLAAGGFGSPVILENSGIECRKSLFVDPVLCVAGPLPGLGQDRQLLMPFISQQDGYILSPYMDYLSFFFHKKWKLPMKDLASIMIKMADEEVGDVKEVGAFGMNTGSRNGKLSSCGLRTTRINKAMTPMDDERMARAVAQCREILVKMGVPEDKQFLGTLNAGHPGGMLPLTAAEKDTLHNPKLPSNLYVADATILPESMGNPPILTIMALAKRVAKIIKAEF